MQSINIYEKGISYLGAVLSVYMENCAYFVMYLLCLIYILVKGSEKEKEIFIPSSILLFLTVYNPIVAYLVNRFFDINNEYYRLFWIAPIVVLVPFVVTNIISGLEYKSEKVVVVVLLLAIGMTAGNFVYKDGYRRTENIYQMPDELIEISEIIHEDTEVQYPKAFLEYEYNMQMRQFDPKMQLTVDREDYLRAMQESYSEEMIADDEHPQYRLLASFVRGQKVDEQSIINALEATKTEYIVLSTGNTATQILESAGIECIAKTAGHSIYKYIVKEPYVYELIDYSDVEHMFSFRRLK